MTNYAAFSFARRRDARQIRDSGPLDFRVMQMRERAAIYALDARVAARQCDVSQMRRAREISVTRDEKFAAPNFSIRAIARAIQRDTDDAFSARDTILRHARGDVRVVVLDARDWKLESGS